MHTQNLIIGFGKAGKTLAADLANHGQSVVLVEQNDQMYGGTCINIGCIPSKKLLVEGAKQHDFQAASNGSPSSEQYNQLANQLNDCQQQLNKLQSQIDHTNRRLDSLERKMRDYDVD